MTWFKGLVVAAVVLLLTACGQSHERTGPQQLYLSPTGSDNNDCTQTSPCLTFNKGYHSASPGDTVLIDGGAYPAQQIEVDSSKDQASADVVFRPVPKSGVVQVDGALSVTAAHVEFDKISVAGIAIKPKSHHVTMKEVTDRFILSIGGAHDILIKGGQVFAPQAVTTDSQLASYGPDILTNVTITGVWFHDFVDTVPGLHHIECLQVGSGVNLSITNNRFGPNCDTHDLFIRSWGDTVNGGRHPLTNVDVSGNDFGRCRRGCYALYPLDDLYTLGPTSLRVHHNTFEPGAYTAWNWKGRINVYKNVLPAMSAFGCGYKATPSSIPASQFMHDNTFYGSGQGCGTDARVVSTFPGRLTKRP